MDTYTEILRCRRAQKTLGTRREILGIRACNTVPAASREPHFFQRQAEVLGNIAGTTGAPWSAQHQLLHDRKCENHNLFGLDTKRNPASGQHFQVLVGGPGRYCTRTGKSFVCRPCQSGRRCQCSPPFRQDPKLRAGTLQCRSPPVVPPTTLHTCDPDARTVPPPLAFALRPQPQQYCDMIVPDGLNPVVLDMIVAKLRPHTKGVVAAEAGGAAGDNSRGPVLPA